MTLSKTGKDADDEAIQDAISTHIPQAEVRSTHTRGDAVVTSDRGTADIWGVGAAAGICRYRDIVPIAVRIISPVPGLDAAARLRRSDARCREVRIWLVDHHDGKPCWSL